MPVRNLFLACFLALSVSPACWADGKLMIVGGALESTTDDVYQTFIKAVPASAKIAIIPAASGKPIVYAKKFQRDLNRYGVSEERIVLVPLALIDDSSTTEDESLWRDNAYSDEVIASLKDVQGFWFVGGDQTRITQSLVRNKIASPLLKLIRERLKAGAIVGGTSAGAAIMSEQMIAGGDSVSALLTSPSNEYFGMESQELGELHWQAGLSFLPGVLVDQHFDRKARLGRLTVAMCRLGETYGMGVDENTAAFIDLENKTLKVLGEGNVVWLDASQANCNLESGFADRHEKLAAAVSGISMTVLSAQDSWQWNKKIFLTSKGKSQTVGREAFSGSIQEGGGIGIANGRLDQSLGFDLLDNKDQNHLQRLTLAKFKNADYLIRYNFNQTPRSQGYWGYIDGTKDSYSAVDVDFSIELQRLPLGTLP